MSGSFNPINMVSQVALAVATGGTSLIGQLAMQVVSQIGQQFIQQLGQQLGLPQPAIDAAIGAFTGSMGDVQGGAQNTDQAIEQLGEASGASPSEIGNEQRSTFEQIMDLAREGAEGEDARAAKAGGKAPGWLMAMARALGQTLDKLGSEMEDLSQQIKDGNASLSTEFTVKGQQFSMVSNAASTTLKAIGEAMANMARKQ